METWSIDRRNPMSVKARTHRLGLYLKSGDRRLSKNIAKKSVITNSKQLMQKKNAREAHQQSLTEMKELRKFQSSTFDTIARRKLIEDQNTILELSGRLQELQNEVNCMNDSKDFQDAESVRSGNSHVTSRPVSFPPHPIPEGMLRHSFVTPCRREGPPSIWGTHGISGNVFANPVASSSAPDPQELNPWSSSIEGPLHSSTVEKSERSEQNQDLRCQSGPSAKSSVILGEGRLFKELWGRPTTTADFGSSLWQVPTPATFACWKIKVQDRGMYLFTMSYGSDAMDQRRGVGWFSGWIKNFVIYSCAFQCRILKYLMRGLLQHWTKSSTILTSKEESVWRNKRPKSRTVSHAVDRLLTWCMNTSGSLGAMIPSRTYADLFTNQSSKWRYSGIQSQSGTEFYCLWRKSHMMT